MLPLASTASGSQPQSSSAVRLCEVQMMEGQTLHSYAENDDGSTLMPCERAKHFATWINNRHRLGTIPLTAVVCEGKCEK